MKRAVILLVAAVAVTAGIDALGDLTQDRPDRVANGSRSEIVLRVRSNRTTELKAAEGLWGVCQGTVRNRLVEPGIITVGDGTFRLVTEPAVGKHAWRRLKGCLEDLTVDRTRGDVVTKKDVPPPPAGT